MLKNHITIEEKEVLQEALTRYVHSLAYMVGKVETDQKVEIHGKIETAENLLKKI